MIQIETSPWGMAQHLRTEEDMAAYLDAALEDGDPELLVAALEDIAWARAMALFGHRAGQ